MTEPWDRLVARWVDAGVIDEDVAARIRVFEEGQAGPARWRWPIWLALGFGAAMLGAGVLLFVSAHWDTYSPGVRFGLVLSMVGLFHVAGVAVSSRTPAMGTAFHAIGTVACGAGIFLAGQIFNLAEHWPGGVMLWAIGALVGWMLLRDWPQLALSALLVPAWLESEWFVRTEQAWYTHTALVVGAGSFLLAIAYFTAVIGRPSHARRVLLWVGGISLLPSAISLAFASSYLPAVTGVDLSAPSAGLMAIGWTVALGAPLVLAAILRRADVWPNVVATLWVVMLLGLRSSGGSVPLYAWWAAGAAGLALWGVRDGQSERINMGAVLFAGTVLAFYFSEVMTKLGRSASLVGLGVLFLAGGWALDRARRGFIRHAKGDRA